MKRANTVLRRHAEHVGQILIHDGARIHTSRAIQDDLNRMFPVGVITQSPNSPDFNALDCGLFGILERRVSSDDCVTLDDLRTSVQRAWRELKPADVKGCIDHAFTNMEKAITLRGANTFKS